MSSIKSDIATSLDGTEELFEYYPYLLQDLREIGALPEAIVDIIRNNITLSENTKVLDLGCGKGAVSIKLAKELGVSVLGIDAMPAFIEEARHYSDKHNVNNLCRFEVSDIRKAVNELTDFDIVVWGSVGSLFGSVADTLINISKCLTVQGHIVFDDGYIKNEFKNEFTNIPDESDFYKQIGRAGLNVIDKYIFTDTYMKEDNDRINLLIQKRAKELAENFPDKKSLFESYVNAQLEESDVLNNKMLCGTFLLQNKSS